MRPRVAQLLACLIAAAMLLGCDRDGTAQNPGPTGAAPVAPAKIVASGSGTITGQVKITGLSPTARMTADFCTDPIHAPQLARAENLFVNPNQTLKNVVVYLKNVQSPLPANTAPALLDQVRCRYTPHVLALQTGQTLTVRSSDDMLHNVHLMADTNPSANVGMSKPGQIRDFTFQKSDRITVKCDVHPWMLAHVLVFDHPFFAVTGDDGSFTIKNVPAGTYTLCAWHERLDEQEQTITVADKQSATLNFTFAAPGN
jgi:plastocyanin